MIRCPHCTHFMSTGEAGRGVCNACAPHVANCLSCLARRPVDWDAVLRDWAGSPST